MEQFSSTDGKVNQNTTLPLINFKDSHTLLKTHSSFNVYSCTRNVQNARNSLNLINSGPFSLQFISEKSNSLGNEQTSEGNCQKGYGDATDSVFSDRRTSKYIIRNSGSMENINTGPHDSTEHLKKVKYENEVSIEIVLNMV